MQKEVRWWLFLCRRLLTFQWVHRPACLNIRLSWDGREHTRITTFRKTANALCSPSPWER